MSDCGFAPDVHLDQRLIATRRRCRMARRNRRALNRTSKEPGLHTTLHPVATALAWLPALRRHAPPDLAQSGPIFEIKMIGMRLPFGITLARPEPECIVLTRGARQVVLWCGRDWHYAPAAKRYSIGLSWGRPPELRPEWSPADHMAELSFSRRLLRFRWTHDPDLSTEWTGREWRLHSVRWELPRLRVN